MLCSVTSSSGMPLQFEEISYELQSNKIISERSFSAKNAQVTLLFQCISDNNDYCVWYNTFIPNIHNTIVSRCDQPRVVLRLSLSHSLDFEIEGLGNFKLGSGQFQLFYQSNPSSVFQLSAGIKCDMLDIIVPTGYLSHFVAHFPIVQNFVDKITVEPLGLTALPGMATPLLWDNIEKLLQCPYMGSLRGMYVDARIMDIMTEVFTIAHGNRRTDVTLSNEEKERILSIRDMLTEKLDIHYTIKDLSRMVFINEYKLKRGFQQLTGATIFDYQLGQRIQIAQKWLKDTEMSLEEIATATGYQYLSSFIAAFKCKLPLKLGH